MREPSIITVTPLGMQVADTQGIRFLPFGEVAGYRVCCYVVKLDFIEDDSDCYPRDHEDVAPWE